MASNPWGAAAQSYGQDLDQLGKIQMGGMQQAAQMPLQLYDRFMDGYEKARQRAVSEEIEARKQAQLERQQKLAEETLRHNMQTEATANERNRITDQGKMADDAWKAFGSYNARIPGSDTPIQEMFKRAGLTPPGLPKVEGDTGGRELPGPTMPTDIAAARGLTEQNTPMVSTPWEDPLSGYGPAAREKRQDQITREAAQKSLDEYHQGMVAKEKGPIEIIRLMEAAGVDPKSPQGIGMLGKALNNKINPPPTMGTVILNERGDANYDGKTPLPTTDENIAQSMADNNFAINDNMRGDPAFKRQYTRAIELAKAQGKPLPGTQNKVIQTAEGAALADVTKKKQAFDTYNNILGNNIEELNRAAAKIPGGGARFLNMPIREIARASSDPDLAAFMPWYNAVTREYAKLSGFTNAGVLTDNAVKHAEEVLSKNGTLREFLAATNSMHQEAKNTASAWAATKNQAAENIRGGSTGVPSAGSSDTVAKTPAPGPETAARKWKRDPATGKDRWRSYSNGKWDWE